MARATSAGSGSPPGSNEIPCSRTTSGTAGKSFADLARAADEVGERDALAVGRQLAGARVGGPLAEQPRERAVEVGVQGVDQHHAGDVAGPAVRVQLRDVSAEQGADDHHRPLDVLRVQELVQLALDGACGARVPGGRARAGSWALMHAHLNARQVADDGSPRGRLDPEPGLGDHGRRARPRALEVAVESGGRRLLVTAAARDHGEQQGGERHPRSHVGQYP
jgi:hypothetical protein